MRSDRMRLNTSDHESSAATRTPTSAAWRARRSRSGSPRPSAGSEAKRSMPAWRQERVAHAQPLRRRRTGRPRGRESEGARPRRLGARAAAIAAQSRHQRLERLAGAIPFEHGEFRRVQRAALAIAEHPRQRENPPSRPPPAASSSRIRARCGDRPGGRRRPGRSSRSRSRADGPRCRARPAAPPARPRGSPSSSK